MPDWTSSMTQYYEYYVVDPGTWKDVKKLDLIKSGGSISRDSEVETRGSATFDTTGSLDECYVRIYLVTIQNGIRESTCLGTFLVQPPGGSFDGKVRSMTVDAYTPLLELKEKFPPIGYALMKDSNIMDQAYSIVRENVRAPVVRPSCEKKLSGDFVSNVNDTWLSFNSDLVYNAKYTIELDELSRVIFAPIQEVEKLQPVWTYTDDNSSILHAEISMDCDIYNVPNVVEVSYSGGNETYKARVVNDDPNSPVSTVRRGREIMHRDTNPSISGIPTEAQIQEYAEQLLKSMSTVKCTISYTHGYCPVRVGDCVRLNYRKADIVDVKAKVIRQTIKCSDGCPVQETAVYTKKLWR